MESLKINCLNYPFIGEFSYPKTLAKNSNFFRNKVFRKNIFRKSMLNGFEVKCNSDDITSKNKIELKEKEKEIKEEIMMKIDAESTQNVLKNNLNEKVYSKDGMDVSKYDNLLNKYDHHLKYRYKKFLEKKSEIEKYENGLVNFSKGYEKFGFNKENGQIVYREWIPAASCVQLIGDFNNWNGQNHQLQKDKFGVWSIHVADIPHKSRVKVRIQTCNGGWVDRIPAWVKWATAEVGKMAAKYDGIYWDPPPNERYEFKHPRVPKPKTLRIYEAHVGMSSSEPKVSTYTEFADQVLPRIRTNGYNTIQLMGIMEHAYYASFGYHVTNFFAPSSRSGTPNQLKYLIDRAHALGLYVLMDVVHSHASNNADDGLNGFDFGQRTVDSYFHSGERGYHALWDSRCFNYANWEVLRYLLSNLRFWVFEYGFDGFRFDGVTSMLYHHHGINMSFSGSYDEYFSTSTDVDAVVYLMLANDMLHDLEFDTVTIAEDVSGMPTLCNQVTEGGIGFDYRLAMGIPDFWIGYLKNKPDEDWKMSQIVSTLTNRRYTEKCIGYAESHDQCMVGDKSFAFLLMDAQMYSAMSVFNIDNPTVNRGIALHKMVHFITFVLGGDGYLNFMGNEFGHPEWVDFPREGNNWSYEKCRRQWNLVDTDHLKYKYMNAFDQAMNKLEQKFSFLSSDHQMVSFYDDEDKIIVCERGELVFVFNFHPKNDYSGLKIGCPFPGKFRVALDSDAEEFGGLGRVDPVVDHFSSPEGIPGKPETNFNNRCASIMVLSPSRSCQAYYRVPE